MSYETCTEFIFFFLMIRRPPRSTLFPTRRSSDLTLGYNFKPWREAKAIADGPSILNYVRETARENRSEEHTSELQSQSNLVCRLLLEKKNTIPKPAIVKNVIN